jgi:ABC-type Mn2+/Zn2+ transport system permease subunit
LRLASVNTGVPAVFWAVILIGAFFNIVLSYLYHTSSLKMHVLLTSIFSIFLGLMIFLVAAVDNPFRGEVSVQPDEYLYLLNGLEDLLANRPD